MASGDPQYSFTLIDSAGNAKPLNFVDGIAVAPSEEGTYTLYASYTEYGTTYYSNGIPFIVKKPDPYWFYFGDTKTLVLKSGPDVPAGYGASVTGSGKIPQRIYYDSNTWSAYSPEMVKAVVADEISAPKNMGGWFDNAENLASLEGFENLDTSNVTDMHALFAECSALEDISCLANWDTSHVTTMENMFNNCFSLEDISALAEWDTRSVTKMDQMFIECTALKNISGLAKWNTSSVNTMHYIFYKCSALEDISALAKWNTSNVTKMSSIFSECKKVTNWTSLNGWDVSKVTEHYGAFYNCKDPLPSWADASWR